MRKISILIIDDHAMVRESLAMILNQVESFEVIGHSGDTEEAFRMITENLPTVILLDINMRPVSGFQLAEEIFKKFPRQKIIGISAITFPAYAKKIMKLGGKGYVSKSSNRYELEEAIMTVANGYTYISSDILKLIEESKETTDAEDEGELSARELEIIREISIGSSSKEIAERLGISIKTVEVHRHHVMKKTGAKNTAALIMFMISQGMQ